LKGYFLCLTHTNNVDDEGMKLIHLQTLFRQFEVHTHIYIPTPILGTKVLFMGGTIYLSF